MSGGRWEGETAEPRGLAIFRLLLFLLGYPAEASLEDKGPLAKP